MGEQQQESGNSLKSKIDSRVKSREISIEDLRHSLFMDARQVINPFKMLAHLFRKGIISDGENQPDGTFEHKEFIAQLAIINGCSKGPAGIVALMETLEECGNPDLAAAIRTWSEQTAPSKTDASLCEPEGDSSVEQAENEMGKKGSVVDEQSGAKPSVVSPTTFWQTSPINEIQNVAARNCPNACPLALQLDDNKLMAHLDDGKVQTWNWRGNDAELNVIDCGVKHITCMQWDPDILVVGTAGGMLHLFDIVKEEEKFSLRVNAPVHSLKFAGSVLVLFTRTDDEEGLLRVLKISRPDMKLLNYKPLTTIPRRVGFFFDLLDPFTVYSCSSDCIVSMWSEQTRSKIADNIGYSRSLSGKTSVISFKVADIISKERIIVAGCENGDIFIWSNSIVRSRSYGATSISLVKTLQNHTHPVHHVGAIGGHLISLDKAGNVFMWSGHKVANQEMQVVPRVLAKNFHNVTCFFGYEHWFASGCSDGNIFVHTVPYL